MADFLRHASQAYPRQNYIPFIPFLFYFSIYSNLCVSFYVLTFFKKKPLQFFLLMSRTHSQGMSSIPVADFKKNTCILPPPLFTSESVYEYIVAVRARPLRCMGG